MLNPKTNLIQLSKKDWLKYSKQMIIESIGSEGQKRIKKSKVLIIGAGGLSCPIMIHLIRSGIEHLGITDSDKVEISNLNRQILYNEEHINHLKVICAQSQLYKINKDCKIITHKYQLTTNNSKEVIRYYDIVIDTSDNFKTRQTIYETCYTLNKAYIYGAVDNFFGQMGVFNYKDGIQYKDLYSQNTIPSHNCNINGIMGITTGYLGTLQAIEAIKMITGYKQKLNNSVVICDLINIKTKTKKIYKHKSSNKADQKDKNSIKPYHKTIREINKSTNAIFIDLKDNKEFEKKHIKKAINIPLKSFKLYKTIKFIKQYQGKGLIFIYCSNFNRTLIISSILKLHQIQHETIKSNNIAI
uniref:Molybdopterin biosynthesis protein n=1 Tax=Palisada sp. TaxID=1955416 RepID=A0A1Z1MSV6_9FLOR|nr:Molybdopterin biosynthesis protein [Palisada sp.]